MFFPFRNSREMWISIHLSFCFFNWILRNWFAAFFSLACFQAKCIFHSPPISLPAPQALSPPLVQWGIRIAHNGPMGSQASFGLVEPSWAFTQRRVSRRFACVRDVKLRSCKARCKAPLAAKLPTHHIQRQCSHNTAPEPKSSSKKSWLRSVIWQLLWSFLILTKKFKSYDISFLA